MQFQKGRLCAQFYMKGGKDKGREFRILASTAGSAAYRLQEAVPSHL